MRRIAAKLTLSFLVVIVLVSALFSTVGSRIIGNRVTAEAESEVEAYLSSASEIYGGRLRDVLDVVRFTALRFYLRDAIESGDIGQAEAELDRTWSDEELDMLSVTDGAGTVLFRAANPKQWGDDRSRDPLVGSVLETGAAVAGTSIVPKDVLLVECPHVARGEDCPVLELAPAPGGGDVEAGMMMQAAAPILGSDGSLIGVVYGGLLLNGRQDVADAIGAAAFGGDTYEGRPLGSVAVFQGSRVVATDARSPEGVPYTGVEAEQEIVSGVIGRGSPWVGRSNFGDDAVFAAIEPIRDVDGGAVGMLQAAVLEAPYQDVRGRTTLVFLAITVGGALVVMALSFFVAGRISGPVRRLVDASRRVAGGEFDVQVSVSSKDELAELAHAFNSMALALRERMEQMAEFARTRIMESERLAIIGQLAAGVAHELNNPLQGVVTYSHLLLEQCDPEDPRKASVEKIVTQADRCTDIIRALLDFSRPRPPQKRRTDLNGVVEQCIALVEDQALFHNIEIVRDLSPDLPRVVVDPSQMQQVFMNLIINAAEAMDGSGRLEIASRVDAGRAVEIRFTDDGRGIEPADIERIFDPFFSTKDAMHGTGLGLAISFGIVREHAGTISVTSEPGLGTTFCVRVPIAAADHPAGRPDGAKGSSP
jgi:two-component system NtrC family sensor kinase